MIEVKFSERIKELRLSQGQRQADIAKAMNVTTSTVTRWETAVQEPDYSTLIKLAKFFNVSTDYILGLED